MLFRMRCTKFWVSYKCNIYYINRQFIADTKSCTKSYMLFCMQCTKVWVRYKHNIYNINIQFIADPKKLHKVMYVVSYAMHQILGPLHLQYKYSIFSGPAFYNMCVTPYNSGVQGEKNGSLKNIEFTY